MSSVLCVLGLLCVMKVKMMLKKRIEARNGEEEEEEILIVFVR